MVCDPFIFTSCIILQCRKIRFISIPFSYRYITRFKIKDSSRHVILGSQQFKPLEFANQINLSMDNAWGIVRCIIDLVMQQKDGKVFFELIESPYKKQEYNGSID